MPRVALVMTVKNEEALLRTNLVFHRHLGVERCYVFDDGSSDGTAASVGDLAYVSFRANAAPDEVPDRPLAERLAPLAPRQHALRQVLNAALALERARAFGFDWLLHLDADELACPNLKRLDAGGLAALLDAQPRDVGLVRFPSLELVQSRLDCERPFEDGELFKRDPKAFSRTLADPRDGSRLEVRGFYGHSFGKCAVRVGLPVRPESVHAFVGRDGSRPRMAVAGYLLHYYMYSFDNFVAANRRAGIQPDHYPGGMPVPAHKVLFRSLVNDPSLAPTQLRDFFTSGLLFGEAEISRLRPRRRLGFLLGRPPIVSVGAVRETLARLDTGRPGGG